MPGPPTRLTWLMIAVALFFIGTIFVVADQLATQRAVDAEIARAQTSAGLLASGFRRELDKFRLASVVLAQEPDARAALIRHDPPRLQALNAKLESLNTDMGAAAIYVMDMRGSTLVASNWRLATSFVGSNYAFRAYFNEAIKSGQSEQFALGSVSRRPGLYIARRVDFNDKPLGVMVIKVEFDALEADWKRYDTPVFATNQKGVILVTNVPAWRFQTTSRLSDEDQRHILENLEFGNRPLIMNRLFAAGKVADAISHDRISKPFVEVVQTLPTLWSVHILASTKTAVNTAVTSSRLTVLTFVLVFGGFVAFGLYRIKTASFRAETIITDRLRIMNDRLVQANKLAAIGQIAAGVGHEINQPLAAIGSYAENSLMFIKAGKLDDVQQNLNRITVLTGRIGAITGELRGFARKATGVTAPVSITASIDGTLLLLRDRINTLGALVTVYPKKSKARVIAEDVRLEQVLVNLLQNALDAGGKGTQIHISLDMQGKMLEVSIADDGPGLTDEARATLFQPFSSSTREGLGLGLVISRDIIADFGGELVADMPPKGARFILRLRCVE